LYHLNLDFKNKSYYNIYSSSNFIARGENVNKYAIASFIIFFIIPLLLAIVTQQVGIITRKRRTEWNSNK